ncbi:MAG: hypothetical protein IKD08_00330 [Alphaproteobacteria bacterium]|nr:hypothetical protein [Alphaproteobacteria bacterium]
MFYRIRNFLDTVINLLKWPVAIAMAAGIFPLIQALMFYFERAVANWNDIAMFGIGFALMVACWIFLIRSRNSVAATLEHEITHALFAMLTFHKVVNIEASLGSGGGSMAFKGKGNWLITIAPYFFPTLALAIVLTGGVVSALAGKPVSWLAVALGIAIGYHFLAVVFEIHREQTDLQKVGWLFSFLFIPGANLLSYGLVFVFVDRGTEGIVYFFRLVAYFAKMDIVSLWQYAEAFL